MAATRFMTRSLLGTAKQTLSTTFTRSYASVPAPSFDFSLLRLRPLSAVAVYFRQLTPAASTAVRGFSTRQTSSSLNDPNPNWSNRPPKETILLDGCDFEHWLVVMEKPEGDPTRDEIIDSYIKTLAKVIGSEEEARMKIYSVSTRHYFAFGALVSEELSYKLKELPGVRWVLPDSYLDVKNKDYGGEPFINGQAVPYDPKYHEEWVRNNARANERNRRGDRDRPRNFDRSRNFERRREMPMSNQNVPNSGPNMAVGPPGNMGPNMAGGPPGNMGPNMAGGPPGHMGPNMAGAPPGHMGPNMAGGPPGHMGPKMAGPPGSVGPQNHGPNMTGGPPRGMGAPPNMGPPPSYNMGMQPGNTGPPPNYNMGTQPFDMVPPPNYNMGSNSMGGGYNNNQPNFNYGNGVNNGGMPRQSGAQTNFAPNVAGNPYENQNMPGREMPPPPNYQ